MRTSLGLAVGAAAIGALTFAATPASAKQVCDPYSGVCQDVIGDSGGAGTKADNTGDAGVTLPFTGGEFALAAMFGAAAVAGGSVLVFSARRRSLGAA
jgi:hypothetical protein